MTDNNGSNSDTYNEARTLAEKALQAYAKGDQAAGDGLIEDAAKIDPVAVQDIYEELQEDDGSEHDPEALNDALRKLDEADDC